MPFSEHRFRSGPDRDHGNVEHDLGQLDHRDAVELFAGTG
jgi:hypothetical protein